MLESWRASYSNIFNGARSPAILDGGLNVDRFSEIKFNEPKEESDIDIYYEASGAIPMNLKEEGDIKIFTRPNINPFLSNASKFKVLPRILVDTQDDNQTIQTENVFSAENEEQAKDMFEHEK